MNFKSTLKIVIPLFFTAIALFFTVISASVYAQTSPTALVNPNPPPARQQIITTDYDGAAVTVSSTVDIPIRYDISDDDNAVHGLNLYIHFDSSQVTLANTASFVGSTSSTIYYQLHALAPQVRDISSRTATETAAYDSDSDTDKFLVTGWADNDGMDSGWPNTTLPIDLLTLSFTTAADFSGTTINFTANPAAAWQDPAYTTQTLKYEYELMAESIYIAPEAPEPAVAVDDASLSALALEGIAITPTFDTAVLAYTAEVANAVDAVTVTYTTTSSTATAVVAGADNLMVGTNDVTVTVTAEDGSTELVYTITVTREAPPLPSSDASLSSLALTENGNNNNIALNPAFTATVTAYTAAVDNAITAADISYTTTDSAATVQVSGADAQGAIALSVVSVGANNVTVTVTAEDGSTELVYTIMITRADPPPPSSDAGLAVLALEENGNSIALDPAFTTTVTTYTAAVDNAVTAVDIDYTTSDSGATVQISGDSGLGNVALNNVGANTITITVTASDSTVQVYTIIVTRAAAVSVTLNPADDISSVNQASYTLSGSCSEEGVRVEVDVGGELRNPDCTSGAWSATIDFTAISVADDDDVFIVIEHSTAPAVTISVVKDTVTTITAPVDVVDFEATAMTTLVTLGTATNTESGATVTPTPNAFGIGTTTVTWTAVDALGNIATDTQLVTVVDTTGPAITAPGNTGKPLAGADSVTVTLADLGTATATDLVDGAVTPTATIDGNNLPQQLTMGVYTVLWSATDSRGNSSTVTQQFSVADLVVIAPDATTVEATAELTMVDIGHAQAIGATGNTITATNIVATAFDSDDNTITFSAPPTSPTVGSFPVGTTTVTWTATDGASSATATQLVTVEDTTGPTVTAPASVTIIGSAATLTLADLLVGGTTATATDLVDGAITTITPTIDGSGLPQTLNEGDYTVIWTASDSRNNAGSATQQVTIAQITITLPADITVEADTELTAVAIGTATAVDADGNPITVTPDNTGPFPVGPTIVTWTASAAGVTVTAEQFITVTDSTGPTVTAPADTTIIGSYKQVTAQALQALSSATATDLVDGTIATVTPTIDGMTLPQTLNADDYTVVWTATDEAGNDGTATQQLTIADLMIAAPISINSEATARLTTIDIGRASATDTSNVAIDQSDIVASTTGPFPLGTTTVVWTATDQFGNTITADQFITVENSSAPIISIAENPLTTDAEGRLTNFSFAKLGIAITDSTEFTTTYSLNQQSAVDIDIDVGSLNMATGANTLAITATDIFGLQSTATLPITVTPGVNFSVDQVVAGNAKVFVEAVLDGNAASYPVVVPYIIEGAGNLQTTSTGTIRIVSGTTGTAQFTANDLAASVTRTAVVFSVDVNQLANNVIARGTPTHTVSIVNQNVAPIIASVVITQGGASSSVINSNSDTLVTVTARDANNDSLTYAFDLTQVLSISSQIDSASNTFTISSNSSLMAGTATLAVTVSDGNLATSVLKRLVVTTAPTRADGDGDGVIDEFDNDNAGPISHELVIDTANGVTAVITAQPGVVLTVGSSALAEGSGAGLDLDELADSSTYGVNFSTDVDLIDYEASNLPEAGVSIPIVFALLSASPEFSYLRKYNEFDNAWQLFVRDDNNDIYVGVTANPLGRCPVAGTVGVYERLADSGLLRDSDRNAIWCIQLEIEDGGPNDADGRANGVIVDPVGAVEVLAADDSTLSNLQLFADGSELMFDFNPATTTYAPAVADGVVSIAVEATANNDFATVDAPDTVTLVEGGSTIVVTVTAVDGSKTQYRLTVSRMGDATPPPSFGGPTGGSGMTSTREPILIREGSGALGIILVSLLASLVVFRRRFSV